VESGLGRRRSQRVDLRVPVRLTVHGGSFETSTVLVSRHGALVLHPFALPVGTRLMLRHLLNGQERTFRVVWAWPDGDSEGFKLGLEMLETTSGFWGPAYEQLADPVSTG